MFVTIFNQYNIMSCISCMHSHNHHIYTSHACACVRVYFNDRQQIINSILCMPFLFHSIQAAGNFTLIEYNWDASYHVVSSVSPFLLLLMMIMGVWLLVCFCCELRRKRYTIIHILAVLVCHTLTVNCKLFILHACQCTTM